jgi:two-component sensor histidine kinase
MKAFQDIPLEVQQKWQKIITIMAALAHVPAGLIMRLRDEDITVFLSSDTEKNPYTPGDSEHFAGSGLYCETVITSDSMLLVPDALADEGWKDNPDVDLNMISYLGFPIHYPDRTPFGTICILDSKSNSYSSLIQGLVASFRDTIERDIELLAMNQSLTEQNAQIRVLLEEKELLLQEIHHRVKNNIAAIEGMMFLQADSAKNSEVRSAIESAAFRVQGTRVLYEKLLQSEQSYQAVSIKAYIEGLLDSIRVVFSETKDVHISMDICDFSFPAKKVMPVGIIINELITNMYKYAFVGRSDNHIAISLCRNDGQVHLSIQDNGVGIPQEKTVVSNSAHDDGIAGSGFGLMLVQMLIESLHGSFCIENCAGTKFTITFPVE